MLHSLSGWLGILSLVVIASGVADFGLIAQGQLSPAYARRTVRVASIQYPHSTLTESNHQWTIKRWLPLPV